jgi:hypothetical protein
MLNSDGGDSVVLGFHHHPRRKGKPLSLEHRAKISAAKSTENHPLFGKLRTPETRAKISLLSKASRKAWSTARR